MEEGDPVLQRRLAIQRQEEELNVPHHKREVWSSTVKNVNQSLQNRAQVALNQIDRQLGVTSTVQPVKQDQLVVYEIKEHYEPDLKIGSMGLEDGEVQEISPNNAAKNQDNTDKDSTNPVTKTATTTTTTTITPSMVLGDPIEVPQGICPKTPESDIPMMEDADKDMIEKTIMDINENLQESDKENNHYKVFSRPDPSGCLGENCNNITCTNPFCKASNLPNFYNLPAFIKNAKDIIYKHLENVENSEGFVGFDIQGKQSEVHTLFNDIYDIYSDLKPLQLYRETQPSDADIAQRHTQKASKSKRKCPFSFSKSLDALNEKDGVTSLETTDSHNPEGNTDVRRRYSRYFDNDDTYKSANIFNDKNSAKNGSKTLGSDVNNNSTFNNFKNNYNQVRKHCMCCGVYKLLKELKEVKCRHSICHECFANLFIGQPAWECLTCGEFIINETGTDTKDFTDVSNIVNEIKS
jgi:hypothetical protein